MRTHTILVTGGCGFIGSNFIRTAAELVPEARIVCLDNLTYAGNLANIAGVENKTQLRFVRGDICDEDLVNRIFEEEKINTVIHFAAESHVDRSIHGPAEFVRTNVMGTLVLLETARARWIGQKKADDRTRFIHVSTDEVYGSLGSRGYFRETTPYDPRSPYSASKASSDHLVNAYFHTYGLPAIITNCSNNYGPYQFPEKLIPLITLNAFEGVELPVYGDGKYVRDWLHVEDHCEALAAILAKGRPGDSYNIGGNNERTNISLVEEICDLVDRMAQPLPSGMPRRSLIRFVKDRPGHDRRYAIDAGKIREEIGWMPRMDPKLGLELTVAWYLDHPEWVASVRDGSYREYYERMYGGR